MQFNKNLLLGGGGIGYSLELYIKICVPLIMFLADIILCIAL